VTAEERAKRLREYGWSPPNTDPAYWDVIIGKEFAEAEKAARDERDREWQARWEKSGEHPPWESLLADAVWRGKIEEAAAAEREAEKDTKRLDKLEADRASGNCAFWDYGGQCEWNRHHGRAVGKDFWDEDKDADIRGTIDALMEADKSG